MTLLDEEILAVERKVWMVEAGRAGEKGRRRDEEGELRHTRPSKHTP